MNPRVSVCMTTYNHEKFIAEAIDGVLMQKTNFDFELIISEDCSTDKTRDIVLKYKEKFPDKIRLLLRESNYGMMKNTAETFRACKSEYIAWCEGDDYWTDPLKLQKQIDFLDSHKEFSMVSHNVHILNEDKGLTKWTKWRLQSVFDLPHLLAYGSVAATCSLVFRGEIIKNLPDWYEKVHGGDWSLQVLCASRGKIKYFNTIMAVYRKHGSNSLAAANQAAAEKNESDFALPAKYGMEMSAAMNKHFNFQYDDLIRRSNISFLLYYVKSYLKSGDIKMARKYLADIFNEAWSLKFWNVFFHYPQILILAFIMVIPEKTGIFLVQIMVKRFNKNYIK